jgi:hypothetical protein
MQEQELRQVWGWALSQTLAVTADKVRDLLNDNDKSNYAVATYFPLYRTIIAQAQQIAEKCRCGTTWTASAITSTAGSSADISLLSTYTYRAVTALRDTTYGKMLLRVSMDEVNQMRAGITSSTAAQGRPTHYAMWEDSAGLVWVRFNCVPSAAIAYDIAQSTVLPEGYTDATVLYLSPSLLRVVEHAAALELGMSMLPEEKQRLRLNKDVFQNWQRYVSEGIILEWTRLANLSRRPYGVGAVVS